MSCFADRPKPKNMQLTMISNWEKYKNKHVFLIIKLIFCSTIFQLIVHHCPMVLWHIFNCFITSVVMTKRHTHTSDPQLSSREAAVVIQCVALRLWSSNKASRAGRHSSSRNLLPACQEHRDGKTQTMCTGKEHSWRWSSSRCAPLTWISRNNRKP